ncbi:uncharacterized protein LOC116248491 [Nymphaea colorata]|uniref:uncharacterized protein LOC116248491 n=1 Tax=Nymphaea colorata TaxID=210225 RepID=UPI00214F4EC6|nr:uncharacterized protein LOC116248491 [Nymphaea colorata]
MTRKTGERCRGGASASSEIKESVDLTILNPPDPFPSFFLAGQKLAASLLLWMAVCNAVADSVFHSIGHAGSGVGCHAVQALTLACGVIVVQYQEMKLVNPNDLFHYLLKNNKLNRGRLLGLDVGSRYVGLAISDRNNALASPLSVLVRKKSNIQLMASDFETLVSRCQLFVSISIDSGFV